jgi:hypothetical protein
LRSLQEHIFYTDVFYQGIITEGKLNTVDLLIKLVLFCKKVNDIFNIKLADLN